jgi:hypothetical protein
MVVNPAAPIFDRSRERALRLVQEHRGVAGVVVPERQVLFAIQ